MGISGKPWTLGLGNNITIEQFWTWYKVYGCKSDGNPISGAENLEDFQNQFWFDIGKSMCIKHSSLFKDHVKYIHNNIVKPYTVFIIQ